MRIHKIITENGLYKGTMIHRTKENGRTVGLDEIRYREGIKPNCNRVKSIYRNHKE